MRCLPKMWMQETFSYQGEFWSMPERTILPKPYQKPHPPMWVAVTSPGTEIDAADRGLGSLGLSFAGFEEQEKKISEYRRRIKSCEPVGAFVNEQVATTNFLFCHEDEKTGVEMGKRLGNTFNYLATQLISTREVFSSPSYQSLGLLPALRRAATGPDANEQQTEGMAYGDPARIIRAVKKWESLGVDCINFILNANEVVPQDQVMASLRLFAKEVMPVFAKGAGEQGRGGVSHAPLRNARHHGEHQGAADARQPRHRGLDLAQGRDAAAPGRGAAQHDRRAAAQGDASGPALLRHPGDHEILREPGRAVQSRGAAPGQPRRRASARLPAGRVASTEAAAKELRGRWGLPVEAGEVKFLRRHDRVMGTVAKAGKTILDCALVDPQPVSGTDVQYINWVTAANAPLDGQTQPMLIQVDPKYTFYKAERGKPQVNVFDAAAWNAGAITLADPIVGTCCTVDTDLPRIRFVMDPLKPVFQGTRRIRESRVDE